MLPLQANKRRSQEVFLFFAQNKSTYVFLRRTAPRASATMRLWNDLRETIAPAPSPHDINDEMTVILNSAWVSLQLLEPGHPPRVFLYNLSAATQRCIWKTSSVLTYTARCGVYPVNAPLEHLAEGGLIAGGC